MNNDKINELLNCGNDREKLGEFVNGNLSSEQKNRLSDILSDKDKLSALLESDRAKAIINKFLKG